MTTTYSKTPLARKLGIHEGFSIYLHNAPDDYFDLFDDLPEELDEVDELGGQALDFIHAFFESKKELKAHSPALKASIKESGLIWVSWPKGDTSSSDLKRDFIREYMLSIGLVDVKVASVNEQWSGLKFIYRLEDRQPPL